MKKYPHITTSEKVEYPLTPPEGSWRKMKIISFFPNGKITNLKKITIMKTVRNNIEILFSNNFKQKKDYESKN